MLKSLFAAALVASTVSIGPALAVTDEANTPAAGALTFAAMHMMRAMPWCSAHIHHHCRPHHRMMMMHKKMMMNKTM